MRALLIGYGKMGKLIAHFAPDFGITIASVVDHEIGSCALPEGATGFQSLVPEATAGCTVAIDFARSDGILSRIALLAQCATPMVIGTTGWQECQDEAKHFVKHFGASLITAPNFSLGVSLFVHLASQAAALFSRFSQYDVGIHEVHHRQKQDAPSGTALLLADTVLGHYPEKHLTKKQAADQPLAKNAIHCSAHRVGFVPGTHELMFDSAEDSITMTHTARNRDGFAKGALAAAHWIVQKKGWFTLENMITDTLESKL